MRYGGLFGKSCLTLVTAWTVALQAPLSIELSMQKYWSGLPFPWMMYGKTINKVMG